MQDNGIFYTFVLCTTASPIAFTYILPVMSLLVDNTLKT